MLDVRRHMELFNPNKFDSVVTVIGAGATGSFVALQLAKLGIKKIVVYDFDIVEEHNVPNQLFGIQHVGMPKVEALKQIIKEYTGTEIVAINEPFVNQRLAGYVFLMVDSMKARKDIFEASIKQKMGVIHMIETRMGLSFGRIYNVDPTNRKEVSRYLETFYSDDEAEVSACGTSMTVITTSMLIASYATRQLINHFVGEQLGNEILIDLQYNNMVEVRFT